MPKHTPLYDHHVALGGTVVDFHGWMLPLHYGSQLAEHRAVREDAGVFDVSHMTVLDLLGAGSREFLRHLLANDVDKLAHNGRALYSCMLNPEGGVIDDLIVYARSSDQYRLVLNAATRDEDLAWIQAQSAGTGVGLLERTDTAMIALAGPNSMDYLSRVLSGAELDAITTLEPFEAVEIGSLYIARTGYTGEDGYELIMPRDQVAAVWQSLIDAGVQPCGLGARDSLRLEAGFLLSGQDMNAVISPLECGLGWTVAWEPRHREFVGRAALERQREHGLAYKLVGLVLDGKPLMRSGYTVTFVDTSLKGVITSGGFSPTLQRSIAFARVPTVCTDGARVMIRDQAIPARMVSPRFVKNGKALIDLNE